MNYSVRELESLRPKLREDLAFSVQEHGGERVCVIEDAAASKFHRVGFNEYRFFQSLDGTQTVAAILSRLARDSKGDTYSEHESLQMLRWLKDQHLLTVESARAKTDTEQNQRALKSAATWLNPLLVRIPIGRPDRFFAKLAEWSRPILGMGGFIVWLLVVGFGVTQIAMEWSRFRRGFDLVLSRDNWLWLGLVWAFLKVLHEIGHGVYCRYFGAKVREFGAILVLFIPMGYVDATASIGIASKWRRIMVACAGMYVELFIAGLAALWWSNTPDGRLATVLHNTIITGSLFTLFFNANPLMRFDGYYILSDLIGVPNLATRSRTWFQRVAGWLLTGAKGLRPSLPRTREDGIIALYGVLSWFWQILVLAGLLLAASALFKGGGLLFAVMAGTVWMAMPLVGFLRNISGNGSVRGMALRVALAAALIATAIFFPYRKTVVAPGVVEFADTRIIRAECAGFVERVHVRDGDVVAEGTLLVELRNDEATAGLERLRRELEAQEQRARHAFSRDDVAAYQTEISRVDSLRKAVVENSAFLATLKIHAPIAGRASSRMLPNLPGIFMKPGAEILRIGEAEGREIKIAVAQEAEPHFRAALGQPVQVRIEGRSAFFTAQLERFAGEATRTIPHRALTAPANGPLPVRRAESASAEAEKYELIDPHFSATIRLPAQAAPLADGEMARIKFRSTKSVTLFNEARSAVERWVRKFGA